MPGQRTAGAPRNSPHLAALSSTRGQWHWGFAPSYALRVSLSCLTSESTFRPFCKTWLNKGDNNSNCGGVNKQLLRVFEVSLPEYVVRVQILYLKTGDPANALSWTLEAVAWPVAELSRETYRLSLYMGMIVQAAQNVYREPKTALWPNFSCYDDKLYDVCVVFVHRMRTRRRLSSWENFYIFRSCLRQ